MSQPPPRRPRQPASAKKKPPARKAAAKRSTAPVKKRAATGAKRGAPPRKRGVSASRRRNPLWRIRRPLFALFLLAFLGASGFLYALARAPLPEARIDEQTTFFFDAKGRRLASIDAGVNRVSVELDQVPEVLRDAVLATEDRNFYAHSGVDPIGITRALWNDIRGNGPLQGGSTITQQYVKNSYLTRERTLTRKVKEAIISLKVERKFNKDEILERYLNTIYFGRGAYGVQAASKAYFGKELGDIQLQEAAYLAGLIRAPELADAERDPELAKERRERTLRQMERAGFITSAQRAEIERIPITDYVIARAAQEPVVVGAGGADPIGTEYFVEHVRQELVRSYGEGRVYGGGLRVKTTLDLDMQRKAYTSVYGLLNRPTDPAASLVSVDESGQVKAMVGGRGYTVGDPRFAKVNFATGKAGGGSGRQAGSTFKPFLLSAMVEAGYTLESAFKAPAKVVFPKANAGDDYQVSNYENQSFDGTMNLIEATAHSVNTVYAQAANALGPENIIESAKEMGVESDLSDVGISVVLGTKEVSPLEMAGAFSTFARRGERILPFTITEVTTSRGEVIYRATPERTRVLGQGQTDVVNFALRQVVERGTGTGAKVPRHPIAGKTGTTQQYGDAWFVGYAPKLTTAVWMGFPEGNSVKMTNVRGRKVSGGSFPSTIFKRFMVEALKDPAYAGGDFPRPGGFKGKILKGGDRVKFSDETTTTTESEATTSTEPAEESTTTTEAPESTTTTEPKKAPSSSTTAPPPTTTTTVAPKPPGGGSDDGGGPAP